MTQIKTSMPNPVGELLSQAAMEQATGLSREVLRKWELRYQFPVPLRGARGQRLFVPADVEKLQLLKRLINQGLRPAKLMGLSVADLQALMVLDSPAHESARNAPQDETLIPGLLACLVPGSAPLKVRNFLEAQVLALGLSHFVDRTLPACNLAVGNAWAQGHLGVHAEHHYTESVRQVVLRGLFHLPTCHQLPRVLLTTPPGEIHGLGLLALHAALTLQGADCVNLGTQTPVANVVQAVQDWGATVVAISVSVCFVPEALQRYVKALRQQLPPACAVWLGGQGSQCLESDAVTGLHVFQTTGQAVQVWQKCHAHATQ